MRHAGSGGAVAGDAVRGGALVGVSQNGATGLKTYGTWIREDLHGTRDPLVALARLGGLRGADAAAAALSAEIPLAWCVQAVPVQEKGCKGLVEHAQGMAHPLVCSSGLYVKCKEELAVARRRWVVGLQCAAT